MYELCSYKYQQLDTFVGERESPRSISQSLESKFIGHVLFIWSIVGIVGS